MALAVLVRAQTAHAARTHATLPPGRGRFRVRRHTNAHTRARARAHALVVPHGQLGAPPAEAPPSPSPLAPRPSPLALRPSPLTPHPSSYPPGQFGDECLAHIEERTADKKLDSHQLADAVEVYKSSLVCLHTIFNELELIPEYKEQLEELTRAEEERLGEKASYRDKFEEVRLMQS